MTLTSTVAIEPVQVHPEMTLQSLKLWQVELDVDQVGAVMMRHFSEEPLLPGILLMRDHQYIGMVSREKFFERMSRPYALELFSHRSLQKLYAELNVSVSELAAETLVVTAMPLGLARVPECMYEPMVIKSRTGRVSVVDFRQILRIYSKIHTIILDRLQRSELQADDTKTNLQRLQSDYMQMLHTEKMASLGQLVAGVAHEINNPVNFIHGNVVHATAYAEEILELVDLYQQECPQPSILIREALESCDMAFVKQDFTKLLSSMKVGTERIQEIVKSLRSFSRLDESDRKLADIHEGIDNTLIILNHRLKSTSTQAPIEVAKDYGDLPMIDCYPGQLNQVFTNILSNAIDALQQSDQAFPKIMIKTKVEATNVWIEIADNGPGISADQQHRVFEPFFTTKPVGQGTGLGLSISHQIIVKSHGGQLSCQSELGKSTQFTLTIPIQSLSSSQPSPIQAERNLALA